MVHENKKIVLAGLEENERRYGHRYCPCVPKYLYQRENNVDFICPCLEFREVGTCHCGLFEDKKNG